MYYDSANEIIDTHFSKNNFPVISEDMIEYIRDIICKMPKEFKVDFLLKVDDYCGYTYEQLLNSFKMAVENIYYYYDENRKKDNVLAIIFIIIGILLVALENIENVLGWYGSSESLTYAMIVTMYEVFTWVFIWEGGAILLLTYGNDSTIFINDMCRFHGIGFIDNDNNVLSYINEDDFYEGWIYISKKEIIARNAVLFFNAILFSIVSVFFIEFISHLSQMNNIDIIYVIVNSISMGILTISNISFYKEKGKLKNWALPLSILFLVIDFFSIIYLIVAKYLNKMFIILSVLYIIYLIINIICLKYLKNQRVDVYNDMEL